MHDLFLDCVAVISVVFQFLAAIIIIYGSFRSFYIYTRGIIIQHSVIDTLIHSRIILGSAFSYGLNLLIGSSILKTITAPTWNDIGQLASIILLRTLMNFFLGRELEKIEKNKEKKKKFLKEFSDPAIQS